MAENGFPRVSRHGHQGGQAGNGRKWLKMVENGGKKVHRGYLVGNGFPRISRHSPTTIINSLSFELVTTFVESTLLNMTGLGRNKIVIEVI